MKTNVFRQLLLCGFTIILTGAFSQLAHSDDADLFGQLPEIEQPRISPDGKTLAFLQVLDDRYIVVYKSLAKNSKATAYSLKDAVIRDIRWVGNERLLVEMTLPYYSRGDREKFTLQRFGLLDSTSNEMHWPFNAKRFVNFVSGVSFVSILADDPEHILMSAMSLHAGEIQTGSRVTKNIEVKRRGLYKVNIGDGSSDLLDHYDDSYSRWVASSSGHSFLIQGPADYGDTAFWSYYASLDSEPVKLKMTQDGETKPFSGAVFGVDQSLEHVFFLQQDAQGLAKVSRATIEGEQLGHIVTVNSNPIYDINTVIQNQHLGEVVGTKHLEDVQIERYIDRRFAQVQADLKATYPNATNSIVSYSRDLAVVVAEIAEASAPSKYVLYDRNKSTIAEIANTYPGLSQSMISKVTRFDYTSRDGLDIHAYYTAPHGRADDMPSPLIVLPHGGPHSRDSAEFHWMAQFYANKGYAVFQPNFRGSTGYGNNFQKAGLTEWGGKMQEDIDDGVTKLIEEKRINPDRICIVGTSYGGYAAMMAVIQRPDLYKCAVSYGGPANLSYAFVNDFIGGSLSEHIGSQFEEEAYRARSPLYLVGAKTPPIYVIHGDNDTVVPVEQALGMSKALKKTGNRAHKFEVFDGQDHWLSTGKSRKDFLEESLGFVEKHIGD